MDLQHQIEAWSLKRSQLEAAGDIDGAYTVAEHVRRLRCMAGEREPEQRFDALAEAERWEAKRASLIAEREQYQCKQAHALAAGAVSQIAAVDEHLRRLRALA